MDTTYEFRTLDELRAEHNEALTAWNALDADQQEMLFTAAREHGRIGVERLVEDDEQVADFAYFITGSDMNPGTYLDWHPTKRLVTWAGDEVVTTELRFHDQCDECEERVGSGAFARCVNDCERCGHSATCPDCVGV